MDYTTQGTLFKVKKVARYLRLYGFRRTVAKVKGQYHMKRHYAALPTRTETKEGKRTVGLIGCGNYAYSNIAYYLNKNYGQVIRGTMDRDIERSASLYEDYDAAFFTNDSKDIIGDPHIGTVFVASNHASHAEYAIECIRAGKHVHIEKPHVISLDQLVRLVRAMADNPQVKVFLGFNRPRSVLFRRLQKTLSEEGGPLMANWFIAGHELPDDHWYFDEAEGGRVLGNLCHWTDLTLHMVGLDRAFPCEIIPARPNQAKSDFMVSIVFNDRSCASITFSAKGHTFEGVREVLNVHKGNVLACLSDFHHLRIDVTDRRRNIRLLYRDHGHEANIRNSYENANALGAVGESRTYVIATATFFLAIKKAIDSGERVLLSREDALRN